MVFQFFFFSFFFNYLSFILKKQEAVRWQMKHLGSDWKEGDVLVSNHPFAGGSHLPDITVITPVN